MRCKRCAAVCYCAKSTEPGPKHDYVVGVVKVVNCVALSFSCSTPNDDLPSQPCPCPLPPPHRKQSARALDLRRYENGSPPAAPTATIQLEVSPFSSLYGSTKIFANDQGNHTTPSYFPSFDTGRLIDAVAKDQVAMNPHNTVFDANRLIGRKINDPEVEADIKHYPFTVVAASGSDKPSIQAGYRGETKTFVRTLSLVRSANEI